MKLLTVCFLLYLWTFLNKVLIIHPSWILSIKRCTNPFGQNNTVHIYIYPFQSIHGSYVFTKVLGLNSKRMLSLSCKRNSKCSYQVSEQSDCWTLFPTLTWGVEVLAHQCHIARGTFLMLRVCKTCRRNTLRVLSNSQWVISSNIIV